MSYINGLLKNLGTLGGTYSTALGINDLNQLVGQATTSGDLASHAFLYSNGTMTDLGTLGGPNSQADAINNNGQVTGDSFDAALNTVAFLYSNGSMTRLGTLGGTYSEGFGINLSGQIVGQSTTTGGCLRSRLFVQWRGHEQPRNPGWQQ
jgi:probable HAF family extracellular repeat protein